eukprot:NODE_252_length_12846_cov_0.309485.p12 type:complete len:142 gc:universal NODE_252_length_12846_cov_0.309485:3387-2962(-)
MSTCITFLIYYFIRCESRGKKMHGSQTHLDALSITRTLDAYLDAINNGFVPLSDVFGDLEYRKWRFRKDSLRRKIDDLVYIEVMTGKKQCCNVVVDRDVNASINIDQVVKSYCCAYEKPRWQEEHLLRDADYVHQSKPYPK